MAKRKPVTIANNVIHNESNTLAIKNKSMSIRFCKEHSQKNGPRPYERIVLGDATIVMTVKPQNSVEVDGVIEIGGYISNEQNGDLDFGLSFLNRKNQERVSQKILSASGGDLVEITFINADFNAFFIKGVLVEHFVDGNYV
jgi:hypothetical protein